MFKVMESVVEKINTTNNGKLMLVNLTAEERKVVGDMKVQGMVRSATFLNFGDSIKLTERYKRTL